MVSEIDIRAEIARIESSGSGSVGKARRLLRVARNVRSAAKKLALLSHHRYASGDALGGARFREATQRLVDVHDDVRNRAAEALREPQLAGGAK